MKFKIGNFVSFFFPIESTFFSFYYDFNNFLRAAP